LLASLAPGIAALAAAAPAPAIRLRRVSFPERSAARSPSPVRLIAGTEVLVALLTLAFGSRFARAGSETHQTLPRQAVSHEFASTMDRPSRMST